MSYPASGRPMILGRCPRSWHRRERSSGSPSAPCGHVPAPGRAHKDGQAVPPPLTPGYPAPMPPPKYTIGRDMDPELVDA